MGVGERCSPPRRGGWGVASMFGMTKTISDEPSGADSKGATEEQVERIRDIKGGETMGYKGEAREEHSGQNEPRETPEPDGDLADNKGVPTV